MSMSEEIPTGDPAAATVRASLRVEAGGVLVVRLFTQNRMMAPALLRPVVDDWVAGDGQILPAQARLEPSYAYLLQGSEVRQTITLPVASHLRPGTPLRSAIRFPGVEEAGVPLAVEVAAAGSLGSSFVDHDLRVSLPLAAAAGPAGGDRPAGTSAEVSYSLAAGLAGFEMIPARWVVAEVLALVCQAGSAYGVTPEGARLLDALGRTRFFKNGVLAFAAAQVPRWVSGGLSAASGLHAALGGQKGQGRLVYIWERWLLSLVDADVESAPDGPAARVPESTVESFVSREGLAADRWFGDLVLGLASLSPRLAAALEIIAAAAPPAPAADGPPTGEAAGPPDDVMGEGGSIQR
jgi:hypothetical protein